MTSPLPVPPADRGVEEDPDAGLLAAFAGGDPTAARVLTERLGPRVLAQALRRLGRRAEAEEVTQEAMLRLWRAAPGWRTGEARVTTWLYRVTENLCTDRLRRRREGPPLDTVPEPVDPAQTITEALQNTDRAAALQAALDQLPARQAEAVRLRHLDGLTNPQIAEIMGQSVEAVESLTARGKRALAKRLLGRKEELGYSDD